MCTALHHGTLDNESSATECVGSSFPYIVRIIIGPGDRRFFDGEKFIIKAREFKEMTGLNEGLALKSTQVLTIFVTIILVSLLFWFLNKTKTGKSMKAYSDNEDLALLMSVNADQAFLHEAPSGSTKKVYIVTKGYPLEVVVSLKEWKKVKDHEGLITPSTTTTTTEGRAVPCRSAALSAIFSALPPVLSAPLLCPRLCLCLCCTLLSCYIYICAVVCYCIHACTDSSSFPCYQLSWHLFIWSGLLLYTTCSMNSDMPSQHVRSV